MDKVSDAATFRISLIKFFTLKFFVIAERVFVITGLWCCGGNSAFSVSRPVSRGHAEETMDSSRGSFCKVKPPDDGCPIPWHGNADRFMLILDFTRSEGDARGKNQKNKTSHY